MDNTTQELHPYSVLAPASPSPAPPPASPPAALLPPSGLGSSPAPPPAVHTCSVSIGMPDLGMSAGPGGRSEPVRQAVLNTGNLPFVGVGLEATPWLAEPGARAAAAPPVPPPPVVGPGSGSAAHVNTGSLVLSLPASATEISTAGASGPYAALAGGTAVAAVLGGGQEASLWFRLNSAPYDDLRAGTTLVQNITYHAECVPS